MDKEQKIRTDIMNSIIETLTNEEEIQVAFDRPELVIELLTLVDFPVVVELNRESNSFSMIRIPIG